MNHGIRPRQGVQNSTRAASTSFTPAPLAAPAGQIPATVTEAFIRLVTLLNDSTDGPAELDLIVRSRATGETAGVVPVTEDTAVAILAAMSGTAVAVRAQSEPGVDASVRQLRNTPARALHLVGGA